MKKPTTEGFSDLIEYDTSYFGSFAPKRGDIGTFQEEGGYTRDPRYFQGYVGIQRLGVSNDFCRMVHPKSNPDILFFACALAGTENMSSTYFKTPTTKDGFKLSRDDYMRDINRDGRSDYCRILKAPDGSYIAQCNRATDTGFDDRLVVDTDPPDEIKTLLTFYEGCVFWYRFRDDMLDYVANTKLMKAGGITIDETPRPEATKGVHFNGADQFIRIGDSPDLELGYVVKMQSLRALSLWVYFDQFTNNAHILDFGNGAGNDNIVLSIVGRGDSGVSGNELRPPTCADEEESMKTMPTGPSGAQVAPEMTAQELMRTTAANVDEFQCTGFEMFPRKMPSSRVVPFNKKGTSSKASLMYEVWDKRQRKMRCTITSVIPLKKWVHIAITATSLDSLRPAIKVYINGEDTFSQPSGFLPQASVMTNCYFGKSNWASTTSEYENKDELFKGSLFDVRGYTTPMTAKKVVDTYKWGRGLLGLSPAK